MSDKPPFTPHLITKHEGKSYCLPLIYIYCNPPHTKTTPNLQLTVAIDKVEKLAGLKISLAYPDKTLRFKPAAKTKATSSFMYVVNDKQPGKLIIVMASAKGISEYLYR
jgi:hypothetical protein